MTSESFIDPADFNRAPMAPVNFFSKFRKVFSAFGITEKIVFGIFLILALWSGLSLSKNVYKNFTYEVPGYGGSLHEGIIGYASFINPVLEYTDADKDMSSLIYSGLIKYSPSQKKYIGDLAENFTVSDNLLNYTFTLRKDLNFHDGVPVTVDDVLFTIEKIKDPATQSPLAQNWLGVSVEKIDDVTIEFKLSKSYAPFIENFTVGILPKHLWGSIDPSIFARSILNQEPVGSGPYKLEDYTKDQSGIYTSYTLQSFNDYALGKPYIKSLKVTLFAKEEQAVDALRSGSIESLGGIEAPTLHSLIQKIDTSDISIISEDLPYTYMISFNQNTSKVLLNKEVRKALNQSIQKDKIVENILFGFGTPINSPFINDKKIATSSIEVATQTLVKSGWKKNSAGVFEKTTEDQKTKKKTVETLRFSISTSDLGDLKKIAEQVVATWKTLGADVTLQVFDDSDFVKKTLRPRKFESILYGYAVNRVPDFYPFWHSSQRNDPGLNTSQYTNSKVDKQLEILREATSTEAQNKSIALINTEFENDIPAIAIISPKYNYLLPKNVQGFSADMVMPKDRLGNIYMWYRSTDRALKISK